LAECFLDRRNPVLVTHSVAEMVAQRVYALALGYEDLNDHEQLRQDPLLHVLAGQAGGPYGLLDRIDTQVQCADEASQLRC
jgi:hypothetical protein